MSISLPNWSYLLIMLGLLIVSGVGEYLHLTPAGSFYTVLLLVIGLVAPSPAFPHAHVITPEATINTNTTEVTK